MQFAAQRSGVPVSSLRQSLLSLNKVVGEASRGYGVYGQVLARFGVSIRGSNGHLLNTFQLLTELNQTFQHLSVPQQMDLAQNIGLNASTVQLLQQTPKDFQAVIAKAHQLGTVTAKQAKISAQFNDELTNLKQVFFVLGTELATSVFPIFVKMGQGLEKLSQFLQQNIGLIKGFSVALGIVGTSLAAVSIAARIASISLRSLIISTGIGALVVALTAVVLVVQDIITGLRGGQSVILEWAKHSKTIQIVWRGIKTVIDSVIASIHKIGSFFSSGHVLKSVVKGIFHKKSNASNSSGSNQLASSALSPLGGRLGFPSPLQSVASTSQNRTQNVHVGGITVNAPGADVKDINDKIVGELNQRLKTAAVDFDSGIKR